MTESARYFDSIMQNLSILSSEVENRNAAGFTDLNVFCEKFVAELLNRTHSLNLKVLSEKSHVFPGIDLSDENNRVAVQVTSTKTLGKIHETLNIFLKNELNLKYDTLMIFILTGKKNNYNIKTPLPPDFTFDQRENILDFKVIGRALLNMDVSARKLLSEFVNSELRYLKIMSETNNAYLPAKSYSKDGNIFVVFSNGTIKQLTFEGTDREAFVLFDLNEVLFIRQEEHRYGNSNYFKFKIMTINIETLRERIVADQKPFISGLDASYEILYAQNPFVSDDQKFLYLVVDKYVTGSQLVKIEISSSKWFELFSTESFELLEKGDYIGNFLVGRSEIRDRGRDIYFQLCREDGSVIKLFNDYEEYMDFRAKALGLK